MKKLILSILAILPFTAVANNWTQKDKPVICGPFREIVEILMKEDYREFPLWIGKSSEDKTQFALFYNENKKSWTLIQYGQQIGCVLGLGVESDIVNGNFLPKSDRF